MKKIVYLTFVFFISIFIVGCEKSSEQIISKGIKNIHKEIYALDIKPDLFGKRQENRPEVNNIVSKYFIIGETKERVIEKLKNAKPKFYEEKLNYISIAYDKRLDLVSGLLLEITFEFDNNDKLMDIKSKYYYYK